MILLELPSTKKELSERLALAQVERDGLQKSSNRGETLSWTGGLVGISTSLIWFGATLTGGAIPGMIVLIGGMGISASCLAYSAFAAKRFKQAECIVIDTENDLKAIEAEKLQEIELAEIESRIRGELEAFEQEDNPFSGHSEDRLDRLVKRLAGVKP